MDVRYTPGARFVVVSDSAIAVLDPAVAADVLEAVWSTLVAGGGVGEVLQVMTGAYGTSLTSIPPFAVVAPAVDGVLLAVRGPLVIQVRDEVGTQAVSGVGVTTWSERWVPDPLSLDVVAAGSALPPEPSARGLPIQSGVVTAESVRLVLRTSAVVGGTPVVADIPAAGDVVGDIAAVAPAVAGASPEPMDPEVTFVDPGDVAQESVDAGESTTDEPSAIEPAEVPPSTSHAQTPVPIALSLEKTMADGGEDSYDHLWGPTILHNVEDAAVREAEDPEESPPRAIGAGPLIADVPDFGAHAGAPAEPDAADHDGETIMSGQLAAIRRRAPGSSSPESSPGHLPTPAGRTVLARLCDAGHPSPPQSAQCRVCGLDLLRDASRVPRPVLGRIVLSTGPVIELDRPVVVGRKPRVSRVQGADLPRLVTVPSPQQDISRSHLEVRIEEWHVLVVDLGTTNGTVLQRPGQPHRRLHPNEAVMIRSDDVVDIGEGVSIAFEAIP
jgi:hypothetical protein